jgi:hypothetical protein
MQNTRKVRFDEAKVVVDVESRHSLSTKERERRWFSNDDFSRVKNSCMRDLESLKNSKNPDIFSYRGMEMVDPEAMVLRQRRHTDAVSAVLLEQREQRSKCSASVAATTGVSTADNSAMSHNNNPKAIRKVYKKVVTNSVKEALENGYLDQKAVQEYLSSIEEKDLQKESRTKKEVIRLLRGV